MKKLMQLSKIRRAVHAHRQGFIFVRETNPHDHYAVSVEIVHPDDFDEGSPYATRISFKRVIKALLRPSKYKLGGAEFLF